MFYFAICVLVLTTQVFGRGGCYYQKRTPCRDRCSNQFTGPWLGSCQQNCDWEAKKECGLAIQAGYTIVQIGYCSGHRMGLGHDKINGLGNESLEKCAEYALLNEKCSHPEDYFDAQKRGNKWQCFCPTQSCFPTNNREAGFKIYRAKRAYSAEVAVAASDETCVDNDDEVFAASDGKFNTCADAVQWISCDHKALDHTGRKAKDICCASCETKTCVDNDEEVFAASGGKFNTCAVAMQYISCNHETLDNTGRQAKDICCATCEDKICVDNEEEVFKASGGLFNTCADALKSADCNDETLDNTGRQVKDICCASCHAEASVGVTTSTNDASKYILQMVALSAICGGLGYAAAKYFNKNKSEDYTQMTEMM